MACIVAEIISLKCLQVCNKCGLFERTHAVPRPKTFPRRRRSPPIPAYPNMGHPFGHAQHFHHDDYDNSSVQPFITHFPRAVGSTGGETSSQGTWVNHGVLPTTSHPSQFHTISPQPSSTHHIGFHLSSTVPSVATFFPSHLGVSHDPSSVVINQCFDPVSGLLGFSCPVF